MLTSGLRTAQSAKDVDYEGHHTPPAMGQPDRHRTEDMRDASASPYMFAGLNNDKIPGCGGVYCGSEAGIHGEKQLGEFTTVVGKPIETPKGLYTVTDGQGMYGVPVEQYGDFTDGRWIWCLGDAFQIAPSVPARSRRKTWTLYELTEWTVTVRSRVPW